MKIKLAYIFLLSSFHLLANEYKVGYGSEYSLKLGGSGAAYLAVYVSESTPNKLGVEMYMRSSGMISTKMWQQFIFSIDKKNKFPVKIAAAYFRTGQMKNPEIMPFETMVHKRNGLRLENFFFSKKQEIEKDLVGKETISVEAGSISTLHYRKERDGETIDFWISDSIKPISLVKLQSRSINNISKSYTLELMGLLKGVKAHIDPKKAKPISEKGKKSIQGTSNININ